MENEQKVEEFILSLVKEWEDEKSKIPQPKWWQFNKKKEQLSKGVKFLIGSVDILVQYVNPFAVAGSDKKTIVLKAISKLYDLIVKNLLPIWCIPVAVSVKQLLVYVVISLMIDFIVDKYKKGSWRNNDGEEQKNKMLVISGNT